MQRALGWIVFATMAAVLVWSPVANAETAEGEEEQEYPMEDGDGEPHFLTGLDFTYWNDGDKTQYGPGLTWGLILLPDRLDMTVAFGAVIGDLTYTVPIELRFTVPFEITRWLALFLSAGPTLMFDELQGTWLESHFRWQVRTFWLTLIWMVIGWVLTIILIGWLVVTATTLWLIYRVVKGWLYLSENRTMPA